MLPTTEELYRMFDEVNEKYYGGLLRKPTIVWVDKMGSFAGRYRRNEHKIEMSRFYHEHYSDEVLDTLKHEIIHIKILGHNLRFKREALRLGCSCFARSIRHLDARYKYEYVCEKCGHSFRTARPLKRRYSCRKCAPGKFNPAFLLKPTEMCKKHLSIYESKQWYNKGAFRETNAS